MWYLALLRGINVGGKNIIPMADLRRLFERLGCTDVTTYIQSGNVVFGSRLKKAANLCLSLEEALEREFACKSYVVVVPQVQLDAVVNHAPTAFGAEPGRFKYDVAFVRPPLEARAILPAISLKAGVDQAAEDNGVLYFTRLTARASQSYLSKITRLDAYQSMTIRNWNTTRALLRLVGTAG